MFNCNPPIAYSYSLPLGRGILVDHWSTISRCYWQVLCILVRLQAWAWYDNTCQIQPVQRDRMPSGPTKYMSVFKCNHFEFKDRRTSECTEQPVITMVALDLAINLGTRSSSTAISGTCCLWLWAEVYWLSMLTLSKWLPASHIGFFFWFTGSKFHSALNIKLKLQWHITSICICILVILNNVQLQSTHCLQLPTPSGQGYPSRSLIYNFSLLLTSTLYPGSTPGLGLIWQHMSDTAGAKGQNAQWSHKVYVSI